MVGCNLIATDNARCGLSCMQNLWSALAVLSLYGMFESELGYKHLLLLNMAHMGCLVCGRL